MKNINSCGPDSVQKLFSSRFPVKVRQKTFFIYKDKASNCIFLSEKYKAMQFERLKKKRLLQKYKYTGNN